VSRFLVIPTLAVAVFALLVVAGPSPDSPAEASPTNVESAQWGDWNCSGSSAAALPSSPSGGAGIDDFFEAMRFLASQQPTGSLPPGCPTLGEIVDVAILGTIIWGDVDCDGDVDIDDALIILLFVAGILPPELLDCPDIDEVLDFVEGFADFKAQSMQASLVGPASGDVEPEFFDFFFVMGTAWLIHNNGPNSALVDAYWLIEQLQGGDMFYRLIAQPGDTCFDHADDEIPCGEGTHGTGPNDSCADGEDNDDDQLVDLADPDCVQVRKLRTTVSLGSASSLNLSRFLDVKCLTAGTPVFTINGQLVVDSEISDPDLGNNSAFFTQNGPACQFSKVGPPSASQAEHGPPAPWERPDPYIPVALPQSGGRP